MLKKGDLLRLERPGGGGMGDPFKRDLKTVLEDVRQGYVSLERAKLDYGVAVRRVDGDIVLDELETGKLRADSDRV